MGRYDDYEDYDDYDDYDNYDEEFEGELTKTITENFSSNDVGVLLNIKDPEYDLSTLICKLDFLSNEGIRDGMEDFLNKNFDIEFTYDVDKRIKSKYKTFKKLIQIKDMDNKVKEYNVGDYRNKANQIITNNNKYSENFELLQDGICEQIGLTIDLLYDQDKTMDRLNLMYKLSYLSLSACTVGACFFPMFAPILLTCGIGNTVVKKKRFDKHCDKLDELTDKLNESLVANLSCSYSFINASKIYAHDMEFVNVLRTKPTNEKQKQHLDNVMEYFEFKEKLPFPNVQAECTFEKFEQVKKDFTKEQQKNTQKMRSKMAEILNNSANRTKEQEKNNNQSQDNGMVM